MLRQELYAQELRPAALWGKGHRPAENLAGAVMRWLYKPRIWHFALGLPLALVATLTVYDYWSRYSSWRDLSKQELVDSANSYIRNYVRENRACLYAVVCKDGRAKLELVKDIDAFDLDAARQLAWDRRFKNACPGRSANFGLKLAAGDAENASLDRWAVWSFYNDRFIPNQTRFSAHAFSEAPVEPCTAGFVVTGGPRAVP